METFPNMAKVPGTLNKTNHVLMDGNGILIDGNGETTIF